MPVYLLLARAAPLRERQLERWLIVINKTIYKKDKLEHLVTWTNVKLRIH